MEMSLLMSLPNDLIMDCIARVPRRYYPTISLVCKMFRSIIVSPELYTRRHLLDCFDDCSIYVSISSNIPTKFSWYVLDRKTPGRSTTNNCLVAVPSLPPMSLHASLAVVGSKIFAMGGYGSDYESSVFLIDCSSNTCHLSNNMPRSMYRACSDVVDGKIYVVDEGRIMVFDTVTKMWEEVGTTPDMEMGKSCIRCVALSGKIYIKTNKNSFIYEPKEGKWEMDEILNSNYWNHACVIDDVLYYYEKFDNKVRAYDSKEKSWKIVKGVEGMLHGNWSWSCMTSHCGKLVLFLQKNARLDEKKEIWGAEILVERRGGGEIWGRFEWCNVVLVLDEYHIYIDECRAVTV